MKRWERRLHDIRIQAPAPLTSEEGTWGAPIGQHYPYHLMPNEIEYLLEIAYEVLKVSRHHDKSLQSLQSTAVAVTQDEALVWCQWLCSESGGKV